MQRIARWLGLATQASPYSIQPGAATQQVNFILTAPGQIASRGGMQGATFRSGDVPTGVIEQVFPVSGGLGKPDRMLVIDSEGVIGFVNGATLRGG